MKTNQNITFNALDSYFLNTGNMKLNIGYFQQNLLDQFDIEQRHTNGGNGKSLLIINLENSRRSVKSLVWAAFINMTNEYIENETGNNLITCTSQQLKKYLGKYGYTLDKALKPVIDEVEQWRQAVKAGRSI